MEAMEVVLAVVEVTIMLPTTQGVMMLVTEVVVPVELIMITTLNILTITIVGMIVEVVVATGMEVEMAIMQMTTTEEVVMAMAKECQTLLQATVTAMGGTSTILINEEFVIVEEEVELLPTMALMVVEVAMFEAVVVAIMITTMALVPVA